jgi:hypothetical protein
LAAVGALACVASDASGTQWQSLYCGQRIVRVGDPIWRVKQLCGRPHYEIAREIKAKRKPRPCLFSSHADRVACWRSLQLAQERGTVLRSEWIYDLGPYSFMRRFVFHEWELMRIETLAYGSLDLEQAQDEPSSESPNQPPPSE